MTDANSQQTDPKILMQHPAHGHVMHVMRAFTADVDQAQVRTDLIIRALYDGEFLKNASLACGIVVFDHS